MTKSLRTLTAGDVVMAGYRGWADENEFLGFTDDTERYSEDPRFTCFNELKVVRGVKSFKDLDVLEADNEYGFSTYALFRSTNGGGVWSAYRSNGRWSVGSSADALQLS